MQINSYSYSNLISVNFKRMFETKIEDVKIFKKRLKNLIMFRNKNQMLVENDNHIGFSRNYETDLNELMDENKNYCIEIETLKINDRENA